MIDLGIPNTDWPYQPDMQLVKYDDFGNPFVTFYHATTMDNYESIEAFGLRISKPGWTMKREILKLGIIGQGFILQATLSRLKNGLGGSIVILFAVKSDN